MMTGNLQLVSAIGLWAHSYAMRCWQISAFFSMNVRGFVKWAPPRIVEPEIAQAAAPRSEPP